MKMEKSQEITQKYKHMEAKQHASEQPTNHRRNQKEIKICIETKHKTYGTQ